MYSFQVIWYSHILMYLHSVFITQVTWNLKLEAQWKVTLSGAAPRCNSCKIRIHVNTATNREMELNPIFWSVERCTESLRDV
jgi:hypothetical protein